MKYGMRIHVAKSQDVLEYHPDIIEGLMCNICRVLNKLITKLID